MSAQSLTGVRSVAELTDLIRDGQEPGYLLFWGHTARQGTVGKECLSQWWPTFSVAGLAYPSAEHYMMAEKARLFGDDASAERIRMAPHPGAAKALGRRVTGFDERRWAEHRFAIVVGATWRQA